jgi:hypothetical protein
VPKRNDSDPVVSTDQTMRTASLAHRQPFLAIEFALQHDVQALISNRFLQSQFLQPRIIIQGNHAVAALQHIVMLRVSVSARRVMKCLHANP